MEVRAEDINYIGMISLTLHELFPNITIYKDRVEQGLKKPCFFISCLNTDVEDIRVNYKRVRKLFNVVYISNTDDTQKVLTRLAYLNTIKDSKTELRVFNKKIEQVKNDIVMTFEVLDMYKALENKENMEIIDKLDTGV